MLRANGRHRFHRDHQLESDCPVHTPTAHSCADAQHVRVSAGMDRQWAGRGRIVCIPTAKGTSYRGSRDASQTTWVLGCRRPKGCIAAKPGCPEYVDVVGNLFAADAQEKEESDPRQASRRPRPAPLLARTASSGSICHPGACLARCQEIGRRTWPRAFPLSQTFASWS